MESVILSNRRQWMKAAAASIATLRGAARPDFWDTKDPSSWSNEEKQILLTQSPWAREGFVRMELDKKKLKGEGRKGSEIPYTRPDQIPGSTGLPYGAEVPPVPNSDPGKPVQFRLLARWETARPVRLAGGPDVPELAGQFYVIRLRGLPLMPVKSSAQGNPNEGLLAALKQGSRLERKDKPDLWCAHLFTGSGESANEVLLFFPRDPAITLADKAVTLEGWFASFHMQVRFALKEMVYRGELSL